MNLRPVLCWSLGMLACSAAGVYAEDSGAAASAPKKSEPPAAAQPAVASNCLTETGSLIKPKPGQCLNVPGRVYGHDELLSTGQVNLGDALSHVDPSITPGR
ncbi:MAG: hypothetical protein QJR02_12900 [Sinobacteraceae bacterium]|nr:hypothetical protein [Nevskiaceae bacterium]